MTIRVGSLFTGILGLDLDPALPEWMMGYPAGWVTDLPLPRTHQLRLLGNSVAPMQAALAWRILSRQVLG